MSELLKRGARKGGPIKGTRTVRVENAERQFKDIHGARIGDTLIGSNEISEFIKSKQGGHGPSPSDTAALLSNDNLGSVDKDRRGYDVSDIGSGTNVGITVELWAERDSARHHRAAEKPREEMGHNVDPLVSADIFWREYQALRAHKKAKLDNRLKKQQEKATRAAQAKRQEVAGALVTKVKSES